MKTLRLLKSVVTATLLSMIYIQPNLAEVSSIDISTNLKSDPLVLNGKSGGNVHSNCGNISDQPSQIIRVTKSIPYLRLTVDSPGQPTLLIDGPGGRFCVLADSYSGNKAEFSGFWKPGDYSLYIGELSKHQYDCTLSISQQKQPK
ncbi:hypothetical protein H6G76_17745 [Nostoc sp. FACHB-152]|uniref:hypothetical protein n=1 Tax=unclassified Nostoc TaxID=2593658 RepID=UPI0016838635|nr:hypothetical protein [Nostoc sp. FACHB-145]MBD2448964.1 hypothetical protein [Nostoc sp. FACHB-152]MBD2469432.1 hypothetical protein [Nostoc sp. FACHB-145]